MKKRIICPMLCLAIGSLLLTGCSKKSDSPVNTSNNPTQNEVLTGKISFTSSNDGDYEIYTIHADGTNLKKLTDNSVDDKEPSWSPSGTKIAFQSRSGGKTEIFVMDTNGSNIVKITSDPTGSDIEEDYPSWSPNGTTLVYESYKDANSEPNGTTMINANIYSANSNGTGGYARITSNLFYEGEPSYSPDNTHIAFVHAQVDTITGGNLVSSGYNIYVMNTNGSNWKKLTSGGNDLHPKFSPDGTKIVYDSDNGICIVDMLGASTNILSYGGNPSFSPNGDKIVFDASYKIYVMNIDGSNVKEIPTIAYAQQPVWTN
jgi:TolB protein